MSDLQPDIEAEMAGKLNSADASMRLAATGVLAAYLGVVGLALEAAMDALFRALPGDGHTILLAIMGLATLQTHKPWTEQNVKARCEAIIKNPRSSREFVATAQAVLKALEDRSGLLRAGTATPTGQDELLRPAHEAGYTDPSTLVRAAGNESGEDPREENYGGPQLGDLKPKPKRRFWRR